MLKFLGCLLQLIISPRKGWDDIAAAGVAPQRLASAGFYPLLGLAACSEFAPWLYDHHLTLTLLVENAVVAFVSYFITYFLAATLLSAAVARMSPGEPDEARISTFALYNLAILALIAVVRNALPMELSLVQFMPLLVLVASWAGRRYLDIAEGSAPSFMLLCVLLILLPPFLISALFHALMP